MASVPLIIEGREIRAEAGSTVLEAARGAGLYMPTLRCHSAVQPHGTCRLCTVAIEGVPGYPPPPWTRWQGLRT